MSELVVPLVILAVILLAGAVVVALVLRSRRPKRPQARTTHVQPARRAPRLRADRGKELARPEQLGIRALTESERERYRTAWHGVEERAERVPALALCEADAVVERLLRECGYPVDDPRSPTDVVPGQHATVLADFRAGQALEQVTTSARVDLEKVRQGMAHYRQAFDAVVADRTPSYPDAPRLLSGEHARAPRTHPGR